MIKNQIKLNIVEGATTEDGLIYGETFDLTSIDDLNDLKNYTDKNYVRGFSVDIVTYEYNKIVKTQKIIEHLHAYSNGSEFCLYDNNDMYSILPYQIIHDSHLDIALEMHIIYNICIEEMTKNNNPAIGISELAKQELIEFNSKSKKIKTRKNRFLLNF